MRVHATDITDPHDVVRPRHSGNVTRAEVEEAKREVFDLARL
jgi:hypothetical protein